MRGRLGGEEAAADAAVLMCGDIEEERILVELVVQGAVSGARCISPGVGGRVKVKHEEEWGRGRAETESSTGPGGRGGVRPDSTLARRRISYGTPAAVSRSPMRPASMTDRVRCVALRRQAL